MTTLTCTISELNQKVEDASKYPGDPKEYKKLEEQYLRKPFASLFFFFCQHPTNNLTNRCL